MAREDQQGEFAGDQIQADWFDQQVQQAQSAGGQQGITDPGTPGGVTPLPAQAGSGMPAGIDPRLAALYQQYGVTPGGAGSGLTDWQYWQNDALNNAGGDWGYVSGRLGSDLAGNGPDAGGGGRGGGGQATGPAQVPQTGQQFQQAPQMGTLAAPAPFQNTAITQPNAVTADQVKAQPIAAPGTIMPERVTAGTINAPQVAAPGQITPERVQGSTVQGPQALNAQTLANPTGFQGVSQADLQADPSFKYAQDQAMQALVNSGSASGIARGSNEWKALEQQASDLAARQYQQVYANKFGEYQAGINNQLGYTQANNAANAQAYGLTNQFQQNAALANQANALQAGTFNATTGNAAQAQNIANQMNTGQFNAGLNYNTQAANVGNALQAGQFNAGQNAQAQAQNIGNTIGVNQFNAGQNLQGQLANQGANLNAGQFNAGMNFNTQQANNTNALNAYNASNSAGLNAYQANVQNALGQGQLGLGYQQAANNYALGQGQLGLGYANFGLNQQGQNYNQGLSTFNANQGAQAQNFGQNYSLAQLGLQANGQVGNAGQNFANNQSGLYTDIGNVQGAGSIAAGNAAAGTLGGLSNYAQQLALLRAMNPQSGGYNTSAPYLGAGVG